MGMPNLPRGPGGTDEETRRGVPPMARRQSKEQKETIERVMHEFKHGELRIRGSGPKVKNPKQAIAIARRGETEQDRVESKRSARHRARGGDKTRADLYEEAKRRQIPGRSKMSKAE